MGKPVPVSAYKMDGTLYKTYPSMKDAAIDVGDCRQNIAYATKSVKGKCRGYYWRKNTKVKRIEPPYSIDIVDKEANVVEVVYSVKECAKYLDVPTAYIYDGMHGRKETVKGYKLYEKRAKAKLETYDCEYINPHSQIERNMYREKVREALDELIENDWELTPNVLEFHKWEREYSKR